MCNHELQSKLNEIAQELMNGELYAARFIQAINGYVERKEEIALRKCEHKAADYILKTIGEIPSYHVLMKNYAWFRKLFDKYSVDIK